ncbi:MAG TPA: hypothetical protein VNO76_04850 [Thermoplasmata archaeon]|nr:hypothetical protein [Thermoplasmata archaeon]
MEKRRVPESVKHPLSLQADYANPRLYGGAAFVVGVVSLTVAGAVLVGGRSWPTAAILGGFGLFFAGLGYWTYTRAD